MNNDSEIMTLPLLRQFDLGHVVETEVDEIL